MSENKYEKGTLRYNGLNWSWLLLGLDDDAKTERFQITISNNNKKQMNVIFHNSILEKNISDYKKQGLSLSQLKKEITSKHFWGGYSDAKTIQEFNKKRIYWLFSGIVHSVAMDYSCVDYSFNDFCNNLGYDKDSRKAEKIYFQLLEQNDALFNLMTKEQRDYLWNVTQQEEDTNLIKKLCEIKQ